MIRLVLDSLGDPGFYIGVVVVLAALFVPFLIRSRRKLFFEVVCEARLLGPEGDESGRPDVARNREDAGRMLFVIELHNPAGGLAGELLGGVDIAPIQYQREISFGFGERARVLEAAVVEERPCNIEARVRADNTRGGRLVLEPVRLDRGDWIRLKAVVENPEAEPDVFWVGGGVRYIVEAEGRIVGIKGLQRKREPRELLARAFLAGLLGVILDYSVLGRAGEFLIGDRTWLLAPLAPLLGLQVAFVGIAAVWLILASTKERRSREITARFGSYYPIKERKPRMGWP